MCDMGSRRWCSRCHSEPPIRLAALAQGRRGMPRVRGMTVWRRRKRLTLERGPHDDRCSSGREITRASRSERPLLTCGGFLALYGLGMTSLRGPLYRQSHHHARADALEAGDRHLAAVRFHDLLHDVETEAGAAAAAERLVAGLLVLFPDLLNLVRFDP